MPEGAVEFWDEATRTYYERQEDGELTSRPFNEAETRKADEAANYAYLQGKVVGLSAAVAADIPVNGAFLALAEGSEAYRDQVDELTAQSTRQAQMLCALARMALPALENVKMSIPEPSGL